MPKKRSGEFDGGRGSHSLTKRIAPGRANDTPGPKDPEEAGHAGEMMQGSVHQLTERPARKRRGPYDGSGKVGFIKAKK
jgi:hypothetical protein